MPPQASGREAVLAWVRTGQGGVPCQPLVEITQEAVSGEERETELQNTL